MILLCVLPASTSSGISVTCASATTAAWPKPCSTGRCCRSDSVRAHAELTPGSSASGVRIRYGTSPTSITGPAPRGNAGTVGTAVPASKSRHASARANSSHTGRTSIVAASAIGCFVAISTASFILPHSMHSYATIISPELGVVGPCRLSSWPYRIRIVTTCGGGASGFP